MVFVEFILRYLDMILVSDSTFLLFVNTDLLLWSMNILANTIGIFCEALGLSVRVMRI
jgi:hypothetical protein